MLTERTRKIVEAALGRALDATEEAGYATLAELPPEVIACAQKIRDASNSVAAAAYLQHVVPSAMLAEIAELMDEMRAHSDATDETAYFLQQLSSPDARTRAMALHAMTARPLADERILAACEKLLEDCTIALLGIPYSFGEVRWVAADAVAALRWVLGRAGDVVIDDVFAPVSTDRVEGLARDAGVTASSRGGIEGQIETLERIAAAGRLPRRRIRREPFVPSRK